MQDFHEKLLICIFLANFQENRPIVTSNGVIDNLIQIPNITMGQKCDFLTVFPFFLQIGQKIKILAHSENWNLMKIIYCSIFGHYGSVFTKYEQKNQLKIGHLLENSTKTCTMGQLLIFFEKKIDRSIVSIVS